MKNFTLFILSTISLLTGCNSSVSIDGFDDKAWKSDYKACGNKREQLWKVLLTKKDKLKALDDDAIGELLGTPERNRQFSRGKKNYIYFLFPGKQCDGDTSRTEGKKLVIEFDAIGKPTIIRESYLDF